MLGRLLYGEEEREETSSEGGGSRDSRIVAGPSKGWIAGFESDTSRVVEAGGEGAYSGARCAADVRRFLTLVNLPPDSDGTGEGFAGLLTCESEDPIENRLESR